MSREVVEIPVHELHVGENVRQNLRAGDLSDSVEKMGVLTPLLCYRDSLGELTILDGHRRFHAAKTAGLRSVPVIILEDSVLNDQRILNQLVLNEARESITDADRIDAVHQLALFGIDDEQVAKALGQKRERVVQYRQAGKSETARKITREVQLSLDVALRIAQAEDSGADMEMLEEKIQQLQTRAFKDGVDIPGWKLDSVIAQATREGIRVRRVAQLRAEGVETLSETYANLPQQAQSVDLLGLTPEAHQDCPYRAVRVMVHPDGSLREIEYCLNPGQAPHETPEETETQREARLAAEQAQRERAQRERAEVEAQETRMVFLKDLCSKAAVKDWEYAVVVNIMCNSYIAPAFKEILIAAGAPGTDEDFNLDHVLEWAKQQPKRAKIIIFTHAMLELESSFRFRTEPLFRRKPYLELLENWGYEASAYESESIGRLFDMEYVDQEEAVAS
ncbi:ParB N-terminal domain-containing protein [Mobiluncus mulieris]|uniref:ParB/RepB/Spo0J family partition protein n=1 Tax=Mobiluncus mulieris TaxID=2052 RepID=UPI00147018EB|nr:ParB/RepB/Spo0J family partition protein [Mobiluncus mulieris]MCU9974595.1 chromosome partitioning protein ParB [Mobiluncus mulieris]NMW60096.1 ParB N-terminal domain-containing protein [Mobiluncus mulieris]